MIRAVTGSEPIVIQTIVMTKASNAALPMLTLPEEKKKVDEPPAQQDGTQKLQPKPQGTTPRQELPTLPLEGAKQ